MIGAIFPGASNGGVLAGTAIIAAHAIDACRTLVALHLRQRLLEVLTLDDSFHRRSCDRRAFETGFRRTRFDRYSATLALAEKNTSRNGILQPPPEKRGTARSP